MSRMRILYIDIDALTPSHLSCYGYPRKTSPTIDAIASEGIRFTNLYCSDAPCLPSRTALYCGRFGIQSGVVGHGGTASQPRVEGRRREFRDTFGFQGLATQLQNVGIHTAMISPFGQRHSAHWFYAGFNEIHNTGKCGIETADEVQPVVETWLNRNASRDNWYLHINYWDAHTPYRVSLEYGNPFNGQPLEDWLTEDLLKQHFKKIGPHGPLDPGMFWGAKNPKYPRVPDQLTDMKTLTQWMDGYDIGIRYVDDQIAKVASILKSAGVWDETAIVISADHGENQGELGIYGEHATADHSTCNVPLVIKWPGGASGKVDQGLHYQVDLAPTYMDLLGGKKQPIWDGQSFANTIQTGTDASRAELIISQCAHVCQRSVRFDKWLYVRTYHCGFHLFPDEMLFDIEADPHELHDLAPKHRDICLQGAWRLSNWHAAQMQKVSAECFTSGGIPVDPMQTVLAEGGPYHALTDPERTLLPEYLKRLEATERSEIAAALRAKYPKCAGAVL